MASRNSGSRVVIMAVTGILATIGVGTIYLPFIADRDKVRGLHEEGELDERAKREYEQILRQMNQDTASGGSEQQNTPPPRPSNSMWSRLKRNS